MRRLSAKIDVSKWVSLCLFLACISFANKVNAQLPDISTVPFDLTVPTLTTQAPAAGKRVKQTLASYASTSVYHTLYLPTNWVPGVEYPVIVEYAGNGPFTNRYGDYSSGKVDDVYLGYGISGGTDFILISMPFISTDGQENERWWWGDINASVDYTINTVQHIIDNYGGDPDLVFASGFSRGAIAVNYIGLHNTQISNLWCGMIANSHYDGVTTTFGYPNDDAASALTRLQRLNNRPQIIIQEGGNGPAAAKALIESTGVVGDFSYLKIPYRNHDARWTLQDIPERLVVRSWIAGVAGISKPPLAAFSADVVYGRAPSPLVVNFTGHSLFSPTSWSWDFDGDGTEDATGQNPSFTYSTPGMYTVELTVTNASGSDTETTTNYITVEDEILNPVTIPASADAYVKGGGSASTNYGSATTLVIKESSAASNDRMSFLKFDVSAITANVDLAIIRLKVRTDDAGASHNLHSVAIDTWTESGITWDNKPVTSGLISTKAVPAVDGWIEFNVTTLVNNERADGTLSVRVSDANTTEDYVIYHSSEATNSADRPQLVYGQVGNPLPSYTISGYILDASSAAISNAAVNFSNGVASVTTDGSGYYLQTVVSAWSGTATPSKTDYTFSPSSLSFTNVTANQSSQDFTGTFASQPSISALADAYVKGGTSSSTNYGSAAILAVKESSTANYDRMSFLKFDLSTISGSLSSAKVRLKVSRKVNATGASHDLSLVTDDSWTESGVNWNNQPSASSVIDTQPVPAVDDWIEFDVTSFAIAEQTGVLSVRLSDANAPEDLVEYYSMEATNAADRPRLTYVSGTSSPLTPVADAYGKGGSNASTNYGTQTTTEVKESTNATFDRRSFLKFDKSGITGTVSNATLRLKVETRNASTSHSLHLVTSDSWTETGLTWNNQPSASTLIATQTVPAVGSWIEFDVTAELNNEIDDLLSLRLSNSTSNEAFVKYHSKEATNAADRPQLVYTLTSGARIADSGNLNKELTDVVEESVFSIYPNPASDQINLVGSGLKEARVELTDLSGKSVLRKTLTEDSLSVLNLNTVQKGIYFLKVAKGDGEIITRKIIVE